MSCQSVRQQLLISERPEQPAAEEARHLAGCADCRAWLRRLSRLERMLPLIPVPASSPPPALLEMLRAAPPGAVITPPALLHYVRPRRENARQKLALAFSLAATLALFALGWWAWQSQQGRNDRSNDLAEQKRKEADHKDLIKSRLAAAPTPRDRVKVLAVMADESLTKAETLREDIKTLERTAQEFHSLVIQHLPQYAFQIPSGARRPALVPVADHLLEIESRASRLAADWKAAGHAASAVHLAQIAADAREAEDRVRRLAGI